MAETAVMRDILVALCALPGGLFWRQNVGVFRQMRGSGVVRVGIPGQADIAGIYRGRHVEVEVKTDDRRSGQTLEQKRWQAAVRRVGGIYVVARSPSDALSALADLEAMPLPGPQPLTQPAGEVRSEPRPRAKEA